MSGVDRHHHMVPIKELLNLMGMAFNPANLLDAESMVLELLPNQVSIVTLTVRALFNFQL